MGDMQRPFCYVQHGAARNRHQGQGPNLNPTRTQFGEVTPVALNQMRFFTFEIRRTF